MLYYGDLLVVAVAWWFDVQLQVNATSCNSNEISHLYNLRSRFRGCLNQAALNRLNNESFVNFAVNATTLFKTCHGLLKSAAADLDI